MNRYTFSENWKPSGVTAEVAQERLEELKQHHEVVTPKIIVDDARPDDAPLHLVFEWDDLIAGELHREWQARMLVKSIRIIHVEGEVCEPRRAWLNVITDEQRGYVSSVQVMSDEVLREQVLAKAKADLKAWRVRYADLQELAEFFSVVDTVIGITEHTPMAIAAKS